MCFKVKMLIECQHYPQICLKTLCMTKIAISLNLSTLNVVNYVPFCAGKKPQTAQQTKLQTFFFFFFAPPQIL